MTSKLHELKTWPQFFDAIVDRSKAFELRVDDRNFAVGDRLLLREWDPEVSGRNTDDHYTGREMIVDVTYILPVEHGARVVMSIRVPRANLDPLAIAAAELAKHLDELEEHDIVGVDSDTAQLRDKLRELLP
jgi:hypothetical protein